MKVKKSTPIYISGHKGMVGSAIYRTLNSAGYKNIIVKTRNELDLTNQQSVKYFFERNKPEVVINAAAMVGGILANNKFPYRFIMKNMQIQNNLIDESFKSGVRKFIFLGSSCIYPKFSPQPIREEYILNGNLEETNEPYAVAKIAGIKMCQSFNIQHKTDFRAVMPTNLFGPNDNYDPSNSHVLAALTKKILTAKKQNKKTVTIWGNGKPKREFLHVDDFAKASIKVMSISKRNYQNICGEENHFLNVGYGKEINIKDLASLIANISNYKGKFIYDNSRPNGTMTKLIDSSKIFKLGWKPKISLKSGIVSIIQELI